MAGKSAPAWCKGPSKLPRNEKQPPTRWLCVTLSLALSSAMVDFSIVGGENTPGLCERISTPPTVARQREQTPSSAFGCCIFSLVPGFQRLQPQPHSPRTMWKPCGYDVEMFRPPPFVRRACVQVSREERESSPVLCARNTQEISCAQNLWSCCFQSHRHCKLHGSAFPLLASPWSCFPSPSSSYLPSPAGRRGNVLGSGHT